MPVNIDTIYQRVLAIANKEQRGYITPIEFNLLANQAQLEIFEQYFYDLDQFKRKQDIPSPGQKTDLTSFSDSIELIKNKLALFTNIVTIPGAANFPPNYRTGRIFVLHSSGVNYEARLVDINEIRNLLDSQFHKSGLEKDPVYVESNIALRDIEVYDHTGWLTCPACVSVEVIAEPIPVRWGYDVIGEKALYNAGTSQNFTLHDSEETELVFKVLGLAGIIMNKPGLTSIAMAKETSKVQQEKQ